MDSSLDADANGHAPRSGEALHPRTIHGLVRGWQRLLFSPDEKAIYFTSPDEDRHFSTVYSMPVPAARPGQFTKFRPRREHVSPCPHSPRTDRCLFLRTREAIENSHIYIKGTDGEKKDQTPGDKVKRRGIFSAWRPNRRSFLFFSTNAQQRKVLRSIFPGRASRISHRG